LIRRHFTSLQQDPRIALPHRWLTLVANRAVVITRLRLKWILRLVTPTVSVCPSRTRAPRTALPHFRVGYRLRWRPPIAIRKLAGIRICFPFGFPSELLRPILQKLLQVGLQVGDISLEPCSTVAEMLDAVQELARLLPLALLRPSQGAEVSAESLCSLFLRKAQARAMLDQQPAPTVRLRRRIVAT
jgi:hypothetical protein